MARSIEERGGRALALAMDVTSEAQVEPGVAETVRALGRLDVAVSNAGVQHIAPITEFALADWRRVLSIHLDGGFLLTRAAMRHWQSAGKGGLLLYMGSVHSVEASPLKSAYVAAKHGCSGSPAPRPRKARSSGSAPTSSAPASSAPRWWRSKSPSRRRRWASARTRW